MTPLYSVGLHLWVTRQDTQPHEHLPGLEGQRGVLVAEEVALWGHLYFCLCIYI